MKNEALTEVAEARAVLRRLAHTEVSGLSDADLIGLTTGVAELARLVGAVEAVCAAEVASRSRFELGREGLSTKAGYPRVTHFLEQLTRASGAAVTTRVRVGAAISPRTALDGTALPPLHPELAAAVRAGEVGLDAAAPILAVLTDAARVASLEQVDAAEQALVGEARQVSAGLVAEEARYWRAALDPDGIEPREQRQHRSRAFSIGRTRTDGMTPFTGVTDPEHAALLKAALADRAAPGLKSRFLPDADRPGPANDRADAGSDTAPAEPVADLAHDPRSRQQQAHDILFGLITAGLHAESAGTLVPRTHTSVVVSVPFEAWNTGHGVAWLDGMDEPVSAATAHRLACDSGHTFLLLGPSGQVAAMSTPQRLFTLTQRRALTIRDGGCIWPGCDTPAAWCDAHHVTHWKNGGTTSIDNGVLLCPRHHHLLHHSDFELHMHHGRPHLRRPHHLDPTHTWTPCGTNRATRTPRPAPHDRQ